MRGNFVRSICRSIFLACLAAVAACAGPTSTASPNSTSKPPFPRGTSLGAPTQRWAAPSPSIPTPNHSPSAKPSGVFTDLPAPTTGPTTYQPLISPLGDGRVLVYEENQGAVSKLFVFDPKGGSLEPLILPAGWPSTAWLIPLGDGLTLVLDSEAEGGTKAQIYDSETGQLRAAGSILGQFHGAPILLSTGEVLLTDPPDGVMQLYDPATSRARWTAAMHLTGLNNFPTQVALNDGRVLFAGGGDYEAMLGWRSTIAAAEIYESKTGKFTATGSMKEARAGAAGVLLEDGRVLIAGGVGDGRDIASAEIWSPRTGKFTATGLFVMFMNWLIVVCLSDG